MPDADFQQRMWVLPSPSMEKIDPLLSERLACRTECFVEQKSLLPAGRLSNLHGCRGSVRGPTDVASKPSEAFTEPFKRAMWSSG